MQYMVTIDGGCPADWPTNIFPSVPSALRAARSAQDADIFATVAIVLVAEDAPALPESLTLSDNDGEAEIEFMDNETGEEDPQVCIDAVSLGGASDTERVILALDADDAERLRDWLKPWLTVEGR